MKAAPIHTSNQLIERAMAIAKEGRKKTVAVAAAQDADVIDAVSQAQADGFVDGVLIGDTGTIRKLSDENEIDVGHLGVVDFEDVGQAAHHAAKLAAEKKADVIMKGFLPTSTLLRVVLDKRYGLRGENTLSHCAVLDIPGYHKLLNFTDGGMVVRPDNEMKFQILENAVLVGRALGLSPVKVAISGAVNVVSDKMPHTVDDTKQLIPRAKKKFTDIVIEGPMTFDVATSKESADLYGVGGPVAGDADIFLVDSIEECNIVAKSLIQFAEAVFAGVIVGAKVPVSLVSRTDTVKNKKASLAIACVLADYYSENSIWEEGKE
jgi:phosphate butyryltransferase